MLNADKTVDPAVSGMPDEHKSHGQLIAELQAARFQLNAWRANDFMSNVLETIPSLVFVKNRNFQFTFVNKALETVFRLPRDKILGKTDDDFIKDKGQVAHFRSDDESVLRSGKPLDISEEYLTDADGKLRTLATKKVPLLSTDGHMYILGVATDITELRLAKRSLELEKLRKSIISDQLHSIRSPIGAVFMNIQALEREIQGILGSNHSIIGIFRRLNSNRASTYIANIKSAILAFKVNSSNLMDFAQSSMQVYEESKAVPVRIAALVQEQVKAMQPLLPEITQIFRSSRQADLLEVRLDVLHVTRVKAAIDNLLHNAVKFSKPGGKVVVTVDQLGDQAIVAIEDTGCGITREDFDRIYEPGFTRPAPPHFEGTGMGLTRVKDILDGLGWNHKIYSNIGKGTTVRIFIPARKATSAQNYSGR